MTKVKRLFILQQLLLQENLPPTLRVYVQNLNYIFLKALLFYTKLIMHLHIYVKYSKFLKYEREKRKLIVNLKIT